MDQGRERIQLDQICFIRDKVNDYWRIVKSAERELNYYATFYPFIYTRYLREMVKITRELVSSDLSVLDDIVYWRYQLIAQPELCKLKEENDKLRSENQNMKRERMSLRLQFENEQRKRKELKNDLTQELQKNKNLQIQLNRLNFYLDDRNIKLNIGWIQESNSQLWKEVRQIRSENKKNDEKLNQALDNINKLGRKLQKKTSEHDTQVQQLVHENEKLMDMVEQKKRNHIGIHISRFDEQLQNKESELERRFNGNNIELQKQLQQFSEDNKNQSKKLKVMKQNLKQQTDKLQTSEERYKNLQNQIDQMAYDLQSMKEDLKLEKANVLIKEKENVQITPDLQLTIEDQMQQSSLLKEELKLGVDNSSETRNRNVDLQLEKQIYSNDEILLQLEDARSRLIKVQQELDDTKSRLSRAMGDKLTDNNPNIADLSDKNRPTKISERYQELYDNQWTDAFEIINMEYGNEEKTINALKAILKEAVKFCTKEATQQMVFIKESFLKGEEIPSNMYKQVKDSRKAMAELYGKGLYRNYWTELSNSSSEEASLAMKVPNYVKECFEICWLMAVQDPPVAFGSDIRHNDDFNKDHYKAYTKSGDRVEFVIWPVLLLHQDGPVLCKGVAQGKEK